jgi:hypothetical protein
MRMVVREQLNFDLGCLQLEQSLAADALVRVENTDDDLFDLPSH